MLIRLRCIRFRDLTIEARVYHHRVGIGAPISVSIFFITSILFQVTGAFHCYVTEARTLVAAKIAREICFRFLGIRQFDEAVVGVGFCGCG